MPDPEDFTGCEDLIGETGAAGFEARAKETRGATAKSDLVMEIILRCLKRK